MVKRRTTVDLDVNDNSVVLTWDESVKQFLDGLKIKGLAYHTIRWHKENLVAVEKVLKELAFNTEPNNLTDNMFKTVVLNMVDKGLSPTTINHRMRSTKQLFKYLELESLIKCNPVERLERKKIKGVAIEAFSEEQLTILLKQPNKNRFVGFRDYVLMLILLDTGVRVSELVAIRLEDIRMTDNEIMIPRGKGGKSRRVYVSVKTKNALRRYIKARGDISGNPFLFVTSENAPMKQRTVQERLTIYGKKAKIEGVRVSPHTFRHTFAKMYIMGGGDPFSLQALLGHSTLDMVKHYVNLWGSDLQKMHRQYSPVDRLFRG